MKKFYILGDSFCTVNNNSSEETYINMLKKHYMSEYEFICIGESGSGPQRIMKQFYRLFDNNIIKNGDLFFIHLSSINRMCFDDVYRLCCGSLNYNYEDQCIPESEFDILQFHLKNKQDNYKELIQKKDLIQYASKANSDENCKINDKNILYLKHISDIYNIKFILFTDDNKNSIINKKLLNDNNFYIFEDNLFDVSMSEIIDLNEYTINKSIDNKFKYHKEYYKFIDIRENHLSPINHKILFENIIKINNNNLNVESFKTHIVHFKDIHVNNNHILSGKISPKDRFIYD